MDPLEELIHMAKNGPTQEDMFDEPLEGFEDIPFELWPNLKF